MPEVTVPNYGLLSGLAEGLKQGLLTYQTTKNIQQQRQMEGASKGLVQDESGNWGPSPLTQQKQQTEGLMNARTEHQLHPESTESQSARSFAKGMIKQSNPNISDEDLSAMVPETMSAKDINEMGPNFTKPTISGGYVMQGNQIKGETLNKITDKKIASGEKIAGGRNEAIVTAAGKKADIEAGNKDATDAKDLAKTIANPSSRSTLGRYKQSIDRANTLETLTNSLGLTPGQNPPANETPEQRIERFNHADKRQLYEVATAADALVSGGQGSVFGKSHMMPHEMAIAAAGLKEYLPPELGGAGKPVDADAGAFIEKFYQQAMREREYFLKSQSQSEKKVGTGFERFQKRNPEQFHKIMDNAVEEPATTPGLIGDTQSAPPPGQGLTTDAAKKVEELRALKTKAGIK